MHLNPLSKMGGSYKHTFPLLRARVHLFKHTFSWKRVCSSLMCAISSKLLIHTPVRKLPRNSHAHTQGVGHYLLKPALSVQQLKCRLLTAPSREAALSGLEEGENVAHQTRFGCCSLVIILRSLTTNCNASLAFLFEMTLFLKSLLILPWLMFDLVDGCLR